MKYQFMPMFWGDFLANTMHLTPQEAGAYLFLIAHAWEHDGKIAVEDLQRVARVTNHNWHRVRHRVTPFFDTLSDANFWVSERVRLELTKAAELSNKRKDAAVQVHSKRRANASVLHEMSEAFASPSILQLPIESLTNGKGSKAATVSVAPTVTVNYRDPGVEYRSPPKKKSDNPLKPLPDKLLVAAKRKGAK